jgi:hypothetical protein
VLLDLVAIFEHVLEQTYDSEITAFVPPPGAVVVGYRRRPNPPEFPCPEPLTPRRRWGRGW